MTQHKRFDLLASVALIGLTLVFFWKILLTNLILSGVDVFLYFYPYKEYVAEALRQGRLPLWNPHLFMGAPLLANSQAGVFYPLNWLFIWLDAPRQVAWSIGLPVALAGSLMFAFARRSLELNWIAALIAAILFAFGGYLGAQVEHINQLQAASWLPLLFLLYDLGMRHRRGWFWFLWLAVTVGVMLLAGHAQTVFISLFGLGLVGLWQALFEGPGGALWSWPLSNLAGRRHQLWEVLRSVAVHLLPLAIVSGLAAALAAIQLLPTAELSSLSIRSDGLTFREVVSFSLRPTMLHFSLLPPLGLDLTQILGQAFSEWVAYLGLSGLFLAALGGATAIWRPAARRFLFLGAGGLVLSLGLYAGPLYLILYHFVPGFGLFRAPARWLLLYAFAAATLAGFGFQALHQPSETLSRLEVIWRWMTARRQRWLIPMLPVLFVLALIAWQTPPLVTLLLWLASGGLSLGLLYLALRPSPPGSAPVDRSALVLLILIELFWAAQSLNYNHPTAPQAYHSMRNSIAFLLAADPPDRAAPPDRFLSLSGITYDPGDLADLRNIFDDRLSEKGVYNLIVATKEKEVLFFNLPLIYGLHSVDGYDGGILPLERFVDFQKLFLPEDNLSIDGRLREKLQFVPANWLLSLLNTRWIITDKQFDAWIDGVFYDLQFPARLEPGQAIGTTDIPRFSTTAIGLVSHLAGGQAISNGAPVAEITIWLENGAQNRFLLRAGNDTAEGLYSGHEAHRQATVGVTWPYEMGGVDYITIQPVSGGQQVSKIEVRALLAEGQFVLRGISLIHQPTVTSRSVLLSTEGDYRQVHSGDVKIYENRAAQPRTFVVHTAKYAATEAQAIAAMASPDFKPRSEMVVIDSSMPAQTVSAGIVSSTDSARIVSYEPERVEISVTTEAPGWLVFTDTYYPGWQATINGQPVEILAANILFRAVPIPAGENSVVFEFKPQSLRLGAGISAVALLGVIVGLIFTGKRGRSGQN